MDVRHISFRLLQVYVQVVRGGSISAAARQMHLTQPTVSLQIKRLADAVGAPLFEPREARLVQTDVGEELFCAACDVLGRFEDFNGFLETSRGGYRGQVHIGVVTTAKYLMPPILGLFYQQFPNVNVTLNVGNRARILSRFERQEDDLYLFSHPPSGARVQAARILKNPLQLIAPLSHWACGKQQLHMSELRKERFLMREPGSATRMMFEAWLSGQGIGLSNTMQIESNEVIRLSVASGLGVSVVSEHTLKEGRESLAVLPVAGFPLESHWYLVTRKDRRLSAAALQFIHFMAAHLEQCVEPAWIESDVASIMAQFGEGGA
jgi:DNA-binding transcriptional LysR family regulator